jgi:hypothetical protein
MLWPALRESMFIVLYSPKATDELTTDELTTYLKLVTKLSGQL